MIRVIFSYDEPTSKWEASVVGAESETEAKQCFNAVVLTIKNETIDIGLLHKAKDSTIAIYPSQAYDITPAVAR